MRRADPRDYLCMIHRMAMWNLFMDRFLMAILWYHAGASRREWWALSILFL